VSSPALRRWSWPVAGLLVFALLPAAMGWFDSGYWFRLVELSLIFSVLAASLNLMSGSAGLVSLGHAAFYATGAYTAALLGSAFTAGLVLTLPASILVAGLFGAIVSVPMMRLLRVFFTVATLSVGEIANITMTNWDAVTGGPNGFTGINGFSIGPLDLSGRLATYYVIAVIALAVLWGIDRLAGSFYGNALRAMRDDEASAKAMGIAVNRLKVGVFAISGGLAGAAGCLTAHSTGFISPDMFGLDQSIVLLTMIVVGGLGSLPGAVLGAFILTIAPEMLRSAGHFRMVFVGLLLFLCIMLLPKGLLSEEFALRGRVVVSLKK
jgi:branched-chain amino acid transport system permease protein